MSLTAVDGIFLSSPSEILALAGQDLLGNPQSGFRINHTIDFGGTQTVLVGRERTAYPLIQDAPEKGQVDWDTLLMNFALGTVVTVVFVGVGIFTGSIPLIFGGITAGVKTISITIEDGFGGNVRKPNEFLGKVLGASARSVYTGYAIQMGPISFLGVGYLSMFGGVLERGIEGLISGYGLKGSWNYAIEDGRVLSDFAGGLLFAGLTVVASKLLGAFLYGGSRENYYTKSIILELPYQEYGLTPGGVQLPQGMEAGRGSREAAAFLMNLWQITGQNKAFLPGSKPLELGDGSNKGPGQVNGGEELLKQTYGGKSQVTLKTSQGDRIIDQLVDGTAHESKFGYKYLNDETKAQILKDAELIKKGKIDESIWHFYKSDVTGNGGASKQLLEFLEENGIKYEIHDIKLSPGSSFSGGNIGEELLKQTYGGKSQVTLKTSQGDRIIDQLVDGTAHESKVGYKYLDNEIKAQILKDAELIKKGKIDESIWHFYKSDVTGNGGASKQLLEFLE